ncbi:MAG: ABC transporter permease, partial [Bacteroidales bacterium]|nr:ABC transporter permease [Bacteroidales bacterium]
MFKLWASIKKEFYLLISDKVGLVLMFVMPLLLVFVITIIQDSAFKLVNENKISILIVNHDRGSQGTKLIELLKSSGLFEIEEDNIITSGKVKDELLNRDKLIALYISSDFSLKLNEKAGQISNLMMEELGLKETSEDNKNIELPSLTFYHDPVLQENYCYSLISIIYSFLDAVENSLMIENFYLEMGFEKVPENLKEKIISNKVNIIQIPATSSDSDVLPNSTQHNVPAWTIFAMFFMVVSLGNNIVKERINGSFIRLKTMPTNFFLILVSKMIIYLIVAILQVALIFSAGVLLFSLINLPQLVL